MELTENKIDICSISETKQKGKRMQRTGNSILIYSGLNKNERAKAGVGTVIHSKYKDNINNNDYINERLLKVQMEIKGPYTL